MNYQEQLYLLESQADMLPDGEARLALLEQAIRLADSHNEQIDSFELREKLIDAASAAGNPMKMLVAFSWCLSHVDQHPHLFEPTRMLWPYKWVVDDIDSFTQMSRALIEQMMDDMKRRYEEQGLSLRPYYRHLHAQAMHAGQQDDCETLYRLWLAAPVDDFSDCTACERAHQVEFMVWLQEDERAVALAEPILNGQLSCSTVPHNTYHHLLIALVRLGRIEEAIDLQRRGYAKIENELSFLDGIANHIRFLTLLDPERAKELFEKHLDHAMTSAHQRNQFYFFLAGWLLFERLRRQGELSDHLQSLIAKTRSLADAFDRRNGNDYHASLIESTLALLDSFLSPLD